MYIRIIFVNISDVAIFLIVIVVAGRELLLVVVVVVAAIVEPPLVVEAAKVAALETAGTLSNSILMISWNSNVIYRLCRQYLECLTFSVRWMDDKLGMCTIYRGLIEYHALVHNNNTTTYSRWPNGTDIFKQRTLSIVVVYVTKDVTVPLLILMLLLAERLL